MSGGPDGPRRKGPATRASRSCVWLVFSLPALALGASGPGIRQAPPEVGEVADFQDFTGRTEAPATVQLEARVSGYLARALFKDKAEVKRGDPLFEINSRPYQAERARADAALALSEARLEAAENAVGSACCFRAHRALAHGLEELAVDDVATEPTGFEIADQVSEDVAGDGHRHGQRRRVGRAEQCRGKYRAQGVHPLLNEFFASGAVVAPLRREAVRLEEDDNRVLLWHGWLLPERAKNPSRSTLASCRART